MTIELPTHLAERVVQPSEAPVAGSFVLYWMRIAVRGHENPALDTAIAAANQLGVPLLVYHAVSERYPYASDRHHTFILEGARDVAHELRARDIPYVLHVERPDHRGRHLVTLGQRAALVVTELAPMAPLRGWTDRLASALSCPLWQVDASCVVPMPLVHHAHTRAFAFRKATARLARERVLRDWTELDLINTARPSDLPFEPIDIDSLDIPALVSRCAIDHRVGPVPHTRGGSRAGYARWDRFVERGLRSYARLRNNPLATHGVSRMSAYLHYGHVSPMRIARETARIGGKGPDKYLDELLIWRELSWNYCRHVPEHATLRAVPPWALETLRRHESDPRKSLPFIEDLECSRTGDALWDAAQASLRIHGELHNNVRMTWGKALVGWTSTAEEALTRLIDLNHRYALDGRDPGSYGGILWCLGQFDRPFSPERSILGSVRARDTGHHGSRLDVAAYSRHTNRPLFPSGPRIAVVGAGIAGLTAARTLAEHGVAVSVFDKARGPGGRMSTRRWDAGRWDHGAQYFVARDPRFQRQVVSWAERGLIEPWHARFFSMTAAGMQPVTPTEPRWVGVPRMSAILRDLAEGIDLYAQHRVTKLAHAAGAWTLSTELEEHGPFDDVILAIPAPQAQELLGEHPFADALGGTHVAPCWAALLELATDDDLGVDAVHFESGPLAWVARESSKPGRRPGGRWTLHASEAWTREHLEESRERVAEQLVEAFCERLRPTSPVLRTTAHRWRYALVRHALGSSHLWDPNGLAVCGDALTGGRIEHAWLSGAAAAGRVLGQKMREPAPNRARALQLQLI